MGVVAEELDVAPGEEFESVGVVEMALSPMGAGDIHGVIDEIARVAADMGGEYFHVTDSLGQTITAVVYRRRRLDTPIGLLGRLRRRRGDAAGR
ncbi:hypothetical protein NDR87_33175 [Nocardia sp. CDC159]|uniref:Uncharacterized protein n=1 Tax=Nocardia pulmonis TaxID=2951408 RepID=A0A9X2EGL8_9NOCA|nr:MULTISPECIES: hypothetical protein [Nocardia]MCM6778368.1 hypothetical protein [Nocardia pulmonis]MCM6791236.1 hypothetical protein [Nocardia sp. CDC159]